MTSRLINGDYEKDESGNLKTCELCEELLQNAFVALKAKRHRFYPDKNFGSRLDCITADSLPMLAEAYARQALRTLDGVFVKSAEITDDRIIINLTVNDSEGTVEIPIESDV